MVTADGLCDRVAFLVGGQIAALDSPRSLRLICSPFSRFSPPRRSHQVSMIDD
jgi:hypothetical protein